MAIKLTIEEQKRVFYSILREYPQYERDRSLAKLRFEGKPELIRKAIKNATELEKRDYDLLVKLSSVIDVKFPEYAEVNIEDYL